MDETIQAISESTLFTIIQTRDFQTMYEDMISLTDMIDRLLDINHRYEYILKLQSICNNESLRISTDIKKIAELEKILEEITERWANMDVSNIML